MFFWCVQAAYNKQSWKNWTVNAAVSGVYKEQGNVQFLGVANAGHMVPMDQPANALAMLHTFISARSLGCPTMVGAEGTVQDFMSCDP